MRSFEPERWCVIMGALSLLVAVAVGCENPSGASDEKSSKPKQNEASAPTSSREKPEKTGSTDGAAAEISDSELRNALCRDRDPCHLEKQWNAGEDEDGRALVVQKLRLSETEERPEEMSEEPLHLQWWLARLDDGGVASRQLLAENKIRRGPAYNKYDVDVEPGRFVYRRRTRAGAPRYFTREDTLQLSPLRIVEHYSLTEDMKSGDGERVDLRTYKGRRNWFFPTCGEDGQPAEAVPQEKSDWYAYEILPRVEAPRSYRHGGWKETSIESCAAHVDSRGNQSPDEMGHGFVIHGDPGSPDDARMRAVFGSKTELFLEIEDDRWIRDETAKLFNDHVEIWLEGERDGNESGSDCMPRETSPRQLGIGLAGNVYTPEGEKAPGALEVETAHVDSGGSVEQNGPPEESGAKRARLKITFDEKPAGITLVYSDSDDGSEQERLIATSDLEPGDARTLGNTGRVDEAFGSCTVEEGAFVFEPEQTFEPDEAAVDLGMTR